MLALVAFALLARAAIPAGWMPSVQGDRIAISICSGEGRETVWLDKAGKLHKSDGGQEHQDHPCAFASVTPAIDAPVSIEPLYLASKAAFAPVQHSVSVGQGLAAPPPPATGPPVLI
jgi:hypothetical protein